MSESTKSCPKTPDDVQEIPASELSSEHLPSSDSSSISLTNPDSSNLCTPPSTCCSMRQLSTVKFAPLPLPDPSRKRSAFPLGVAARSRRARLAREGAEERHSLWANDPAADPTLEDPLVTFGKFVKSASKGLWRRIRARSGFVGHIIRPVHYLPDNIPDTSSVEGQECQVVNAEKETGGRVEHGPSNVEFKQWRRSTGNIPSVH